MSIKNFSKIFWIANFVELLERAAYYGTFIALVLFLTNVVKYTDVEAGFVGGIFASIIYFLPLITGTIADRIGFRASLIIAFSSLAVGYFGFAFFPYKIPVLFFLFLIAIGGSFVKPVITGTVAISSNAELRAKAYSLFYMTVNIGSFMGKMVAKPLRVNLGLKYIPYYSSFLAFLALITAIFFYFPAKRGLENKKTIKEILIGMLKAFKKVPFTMLIIITGTFWAIQNQLYATLPKYVIRLVGEDASPEWYANVNPLIVIIFVVPVTSIMKKVKAINSIAISFLILTISSLTMSLSHLFDSNLNILSLSVHPITLMMVIGIAIQGLAECFLSPRYLEFASLQANKGEEGLYMGYAHLNTTFASILAFISSGYLLDKYCPDPSKYPNYTPEELKLLYTNAHYIWYYYSGLAFLSFILVLILSKTIFRKIE